MHHHDNDKIAFFKSVVLLLFVFCSAASASPQESLSEKLSALKTVSAAFIQTTTDSSGEVVSLSEGSLAVGQHGKFRIESTVPYEQQLVSNGEDFYTYDPDLEQVVIRKLVKDVKQVPILILGNADPTFLQEYEVIQIEALSGEEYLLTANSQDTVFETLSLHFVEDAPRQIVLLDSLGQTTKIELNAVSSNTMLEDSLFDFVMPENVDVIDDR
jgi:outer membrane lipoprotein carrier protein